MLYIIISISYWIAQFPNDPKLSFGAISSMKLVRESHSMPVPWIWILRIYIVRPLVTSRLSFRRKKLLQCGLILAVSTSLLHGIS